MNYFKPALAGLLLCLGFSAAASAEEKPWVLLVVDGGHQLSEYYGRTEMGALRAFLEGESDVSFITLEQVFFLDDMKVILLKDASSKGKKFGFQATTNLRADTIVRVLELEQSYIDGRFADAIQNTAEGADW